MRAGLRLRQVENFCGYLRHRYWTTAKRKNGIIFAIIKPWFNIIVNRIHDRNFKLWNIISTGIFKFKMQLCWNVAKKNDHFTMAISYNLSDVNKVPNRPLLSSFICQSIVKQTNLNLMYFLFQFRLVIYDQRSHLILNYSTQGRNLYSRVLILKDKDCVVSFVFRKNCLKGCLIWINVPILKNRMVVVPIC